MQDVFGCVVLHKLINSLSADEGLRVETSCTIELLLYECRSKATIDL